jgi:hypothetical protein
LTFTVGGFATAPPTLPAFHFSGASGTQQPFLQPAIGLSLDSPYSLDLIGVLNMSVASSSFAADPAVQFSSGGRQVAFTIPANTLQAVFSGGSKQIQFQSGTVAEAIVIQPSIALASGVDITPANPATLQLTVPSAAPTLLSASIGSRSTTSLSVLITGFTTTRYLDHIDFQFTDSSGFTLGASHVTVNVSAAARLWFISALSQNTGGQFTVEIPFNFGGGTSGSDLTKSISGISVAIANDIGTSNTIQIAIP